MQAINFNADWTCRHLDGSGAVRAVTVPDDAMLYEKRTAEAAGGINTGWYEGYDYLYEKHFTPNASMQGKRMILEFEGVYHNAEVMINGEKAMYRPYGYTNFYVDCTDRFVIGQDNKIEVIARNADQPNSRWYSGAGIYRPVRLWVSDKAGIELNGVRIRTLSINPDKVEVTVKTTQPGNVDICILDGEKEVAKTTRPSDGKAVATFVLNDARLWSPESPNLYRCEVKFGTDSETVTFGVRTLSWDADKGFCLNGERYIIQGACIHHDHAMLGAKCYADAEERRVKILKETGYNAIRSAHNPCTKSLLDACDKYGMLMMDEYIDHWYIHKTEYDYVNYFNDWWKQDLTDMVDKDYNHPCVVLYSTGNEVSETAQEKGIKLTGEMTEFLHGLDSTRPVTCGVNIFFNFLSSIGFGVYSDEKAKKEAEAAERAKAAGKQTKKKKAVGSQFFNNLAGLLGDEFMKRGATLHGCDVKTRDAFANMDIAGYNYGIYRYKHDFKKYPNRLILGSETFCSDAYLFREMAKKYPRLVGDFVWAGMDYCGEVGVGSWEYKEYAPEFSGLGWVSAGSGRIDLTGKPLGEALYTRVALEKEAGPYIAVCPVTHTDEKHSPSAWKMSNATDSWAWEGCEGKKANVEVYARAASVELLVNGASVGKKELKKDCMAKFSCTWQPGKIEAVSYDEAGKEIGRCELNSAGKETVLLAEPEQTKVAPGHLCFVRLRYADKDGVTKPTERGMISVKVTGGKLVAIGNACPYMDAKRSYLDSETDTYYGEALVVVMAEDAEKVIVSASDGKNSAEAVVCITKEN